MAKKKKRNPGWTGLSVLSPLKKKQVLLQSWNDDVTEKFNNKKVVLQFAKKKNAFDK